jgi:3-oxoacyl-[acyl-carrier-protein] synthase I
MSPRSSLAILACGMTTAVGLNAASTAAAIRARIDGFRETRFFARGSEVLIGAETPLEMGWRGIPRLARLLEGPLSECFFATDRPAWATPVFISVAEPDRAGRFDGLDDSLLPCISSLLNVEFDPRSRIVPMGRVGAAVGIREASKLINEQGVAQVIVAGVDAFLVAGTLDAYDERFRLLTSRNSNGFVPGEAGAALLIGRCAADRGLEIRSLGFARETASIASNEPLRARGLMTAMRQALSAAGMTMAQIGYRISTISGEQYGFKEVDLATTQLLRGRHAFMDLWHPADCVGETGAASLPICLAVALVAARKAYAPGGPILALAGNDDGRRAALILQAGGGA